MPRQREFDVDVAERPENPGERTEQEAPPDGMAGQAPGEQPADTAEAQHERHGAGLQDHERERTYLPLARGARDHEHG